MMFEIAEFVDRKWDWSRKTFGPGLRTRGLTAHIRKELAEIEADPYDPEEWVDVLLLALDGMSRLGMSGRDIEAAIISKQLKNIMRKWPAAFKDQDDPVEHLEHDDPGSAM